jgi:hypothetical protein
MRPEPRLRRIRGFAVAWMLVLIALIALAGGAAAQDVLFARQLATARMQQQRAFALAELGLRAGMLQLSATATPVADSGRLRPGEAPSDSMRVTLQPGAARVPAGYSAGRFIARDYEIESTGTSARNARSVLVQGVTRLEAAGSPTP